MMNSEGACVLILDPDYLPTYLSILMNMNLSSAATSGWFLLKLGIDLAMQKNYEML